MSVPSTSASRRARLIAYYLPQFHPIPENDIWWGKGFTEWTNTAKARSLFRGHYQPHVPADLGFYDLRLPETREAQAGLAQRHGIEGFCYWHYWFGGGKRLLEQPLKEVLDSGKPDFPFCLAWANESWTGIWHGASNKVLMEQTYPGRKDEENHFECVFRAFRDGRYMTVDGKPLFLVYKPHLLPDRRAFTEHWRELAHRARLPGLYLVGEDWTWDWDPQRDGFDASVPHHPGNPFALLKSQGIRQQLLQLQERLPSVFTAPYRFRYTDFIRAALSLLRFDRRDQIPVVVPNWDNTPRSGRLGHILLDATPELFCEYLHNVIRGISWKNPEHRIVLIKSWNEWAEGNYLEPDLRYGRGFLEACKAGAFGRGGGDA